MNLLPIVLKYLHIFLLNMSSVRYAKLTGRYSLAVSGQVFLWEFHYFFLRLMLRSSACWKHFDRKASN